MVREVRGRREDAGVVCPELRVQKGAKSGKSARKVGYKGGINGGKEG